MLCNRGGLAPTIALFYPRNVCLLYNIVALCAIRTGLAIVYNCGSTLYLVCPLQYGFFLQDVIIVESLENVRCLE